MRNEERKLKAVYGELRRHPARYHRALDGIVIYERMPRWMRHVMPRLSDVAEAGALMMSPPPRPDLAQVEAGA